MVSLFSKRDMLHSRWLFCSSLFFIPLVFNFPDNLQHRNKRFVPQTKCYGELGCYSTGGDFYDPKIRPVEVLPQSREQIRVRYLLFTRKNPNDAHELKLHDVNLLLKSNFNAKVGTKIITHGYTDNGLSLWIKKMRETLLRSGDFNVIQLDWSGGSRPPYTQATANTRLVGAEGALMIKFLEEKAGANRKDFHFMGHSLGAHIAGYTGEKLEGKMGRISGLDPAGPYFENTKPTVRLDPTDALFVDAVHTDGKNILNAIIGQGGFGMMQTVGHVDFYPNGGQKQPNCARSPSKDDKIKPVIDLEKLVRGCDHDRVVALYTDTIRANPKCRFKAFRCDNYDNFKAGKCSSCANGGCTYMGFHANDWKNRGSQREVKMFLDTAGPEFFCVNQYFVTISTGTGGQARNVNGNLFVTFQGSGGSTSEIPLFEKASSIKPSSTYGRAFNQAKNIGAINKITFKWQFSQSKDDPDGQITNRYIYLNRISIVNGEDEITVTLCGKNDALKSDAQVTLDLTNKC